VIKVKQGIAEAEQLLEELDFNTLPIIPMDVIKAIDSGHYRVVLEAVKLKSNYILGKSEGNNYGSLIYVNSSLDEVRYNFTAAHELGHVVMHIMQNKQESFECSSKDFGDYYKAPFEQEANGFASGLLMPKKLIDPLTDGDINWKNISKIKAKCGTSLEASYRRLSALTNEPSALIIHKKDKFHRFVPSASFDFYIEQLPLCEDKKQLCSDGLRDHLSSEFEEVDPSDWVNPERKGLELEKIYVSSISLANDITYSLLRYDDECLLETDEC